MKTINSKTIIAAVAAVCFSLSLRAAVITNPALSDTTKKSKMKLSKMAKDTERMGKMSKMDKKMAPKKMAKDTGKMSKM